MPKRFLVTGGAGFIGSAVVRHLIRETPHQVLVVDKLTYAGNLDSLAPVSNDPRYAFVRADIADAPKMREAVRELPAGRRDASRGRKPCRPLDRRAGRIHPDQCGRHLHAAAGGARLLARAAEREQRHAFRFHHISTDEVFGSLGDEGLFCETTAYDPRSPYSASKAASDHLVRAWHHTYGLPVVVTNCSNNYGPVSFSRKADPADHHQCARGPEAAGLRQGRECARLALCRGSRARAADRGARRRGRRRPTMSAAATRRPTSTWSRRSAR